jgi:peptidoglycan/xylan/chitin deacetylase (PgdA/CDA1 family)
MPRELILTFHGLGEPPYSLADSELKVWVPVEWFEAIIDASPRHEVGLAFDDGNASDVEQALPALAQRAISARFFPVVDRIGAEGHLSAEDIAKLSAAGMVIGSHGLHHSDWRTLGDRELHEELTVSRRTLAGIVGNDITEAACPFGSYDRRVLRALGVAGYRRIFTSDGGTGSLGSSLSPRTTIDRSRPLQHWLELAKAGARGRPGPVLLSKRFVKRLR